MLVAKGKELEEGFFSCPHAVFEFTFMRHDRLSGAASMVLWQCDPLPIAVLFLLRGTSRAGHDDEIICLVR